MEAKGRRRKEPLKNYMAFVVSESMTDEVHRIADSLGCSVSWWARRTLQKEIDRLQEDKTDRNIQRSGPLDFVLPTENKGKEDSPTMQDVSPGWRLEDMLDGSEKEKNKNGNINNT